MQSRRNANRHRSIDAPVRDDDTGSLADLIANEDSPRADEGLLRESLSIEIERALATLTKREADVIRYFFGINAPEMSLEEIGSHLGLTRERVRQIREKAIRRLRHSSRSALLKQYLG